VVTSNCSDLTTDDQQPRSRVVPHSCRAHLLRSQFSIELARNEDISPSALGSHKFDQDQIRRDTCMTCRWHDRHAAFSPHLHFEQSLSTVSHINSDTPASLAAGSPLRPPCQHDSGGVFAVETAASRGLEQCRLTPLALREHLCSTAHVHIGTLRHACCASTHATAGSIMHMLLRSGQSARWQHISAVLLRDARAASVTAGRQPCAVPPGVMIPQTVRLSATQHHRSTAQCSCAVDVLR
jgi:hypothetical protein